MRVVCTYESAKGVIVLFLEFCQVLLVGLFVWPGDLGDGLGGGGVGVGRSRGSGFGSHFKTEIEKLRNK